MTKIELLIIVIRRKKIKINKLKDEKQVAVIDALAKAAEQSPIK